MIKRTSESFSFGDEKIETSEPMSQTEENMGQIGHSPHIRIQRSTLGYIIELDSSIEFEKSRKSKDRNRIAVPELDELERSHCEQVEEEFFRPYVIQG